MSVWEIGDFDKPRYVASFDHFLYCQLGRRWCCTKGHKSPRAAADHAARVAAAQWKKAT